MFELCIRSQKFSRKKYDILVPIPISTIPGYSNILAKYSDNPFKPQCCNQTTSKETIDMVC